MTKKEMFEEAVKNTIDTQSDFYVKLNRETLEKQIKEYLQTNIDLWLFEVWNEYIKERENKNPDYIRGYNDCVKEVNKRLDNKNEIFIKNFMDWLINN